MSLLRMMMALGAFAVLAGCNQPAGQNSGNAPANAATTSEAAPAAADANGKPTEPAQTAGGKPPAPAQGGDKPA